MKSNMKKLSARTVVNVRVGAIVCAMAAAATLAACGGSDGSSPTATIKGTAAVGAAMANATIALTCKNGSGNAVADANGAYTATFTFDPPCAITATSGSIVLDSFAASAGTFNVTPLTELLLSYLAGQLGTSESNLLASLSSNATYQNALSNSTVIANAENAIVSLIQTTYGITLSSSSFLTVSFTPGTAGADSDLDTLLAAGAITSTGQPSATLSAAAVALGEASPISGSSAGGATGGTGGTGGTGVTQ